MSVSKRPSFHQTPNFLRKTVYPIHKGSLGMRGYDDGRFSGFFDTSRAVLPRGNSLLRKVYEIFMKTKGSPRDFCENNRFSSKGVRGFQRMNRPSGFTVLPSKSTVFQFVISVWFKRVLTCRSTLQLFWLKKCFYGFQTSSPLCLHDGVSEPRC